MFDKLLSCLILSIFICLTLKSVTADLDTEWANFKLKYSRVYSKEEDVWRKEIFAKTLKDIAQNEEDFKNGKVTYHLGINSMADMTDEEFDAKLVRNASKGGPGGQASNARNISTRSLPSRVNWIEYGYDKRVIDQGHCGCCYAFAAAGALEAQYYIKHNRRIEASIQDIIDCSQLTGNDGCDGGYQRDVYKYMLKYGGIATADESPYLGYEDKCYKPKGHRIEISDYYEIPSGDERALMKAVANIGPIPVDIHSSRKAFKSYSGGYHYDVNCKNDVKSLKHAVLVVGYGTMRGTNDDYWLVRNSWGDDWGDHGYVYMARNKNNNCGIATRAVYPIVK